LIVFKYKCSEKVCDAILRLRKIACAICPENFYRSNSVHPLHGVLEDSKGKNILIWLIIIGYKDKFNWTVFLTK